MKKILTKILPLAVFAVLFVFINFKAVAVSITSFTPRVGGPGTLVKVSGTDLNNPTTFTIGGKNAIIISNTGTSLVAMVMPGAISGGISITNANGTAKSAKNFFCVPMPIPTAYLNQKLLATSNTGPASQGFSVGMSANGSYMIVGGNTDNSGVGAAWIYPFNGSIAAANIPVPVKLVANDATGLSAQGSSVGISADGSTAVVGAPGDDNGNGAIWVYTSTDGITWAQQGTKLKVTGSAGPGPALFGSSVSISADGNTIVAEAAGDNNNTGAAYVFTRMGTTWSQQSSKLAGTGAAPGDTTLIGYQRVSLSADGNTFIMGAHNNNTTSGAAWIFVRSNGIWTEQPGVLTASDGAGDSDLGSAVSISADGNMAAVGGFTDNNKQGGVWIFTRKNNIWKQQGNKIIATDHTGAAQQGCSVSLNADGSILVFGAKADSLNRGAAWVFIRQDSTSWIVNDKKVVGKNTLANSRFGNSIAITADGIRAIAGGYKDVNAQGGSWIFTCEAGIGGSGGSGNLSATHITTLPATNITFNSGILNGSITTNLGALAIDFEYGTSANLDYAIVPPLTTGNPIYVGTALKNYTSMLTGLKPSTTYYFRIVAAGYFTDVIEGQTLSFTTDAEAAPGSGLTASTIPTAFTPNHDGVNDKWEIPFLSDYPNCSVKIFNRAGQTVYASTGYTSSWDGRYNNTDLPAGAYYYVIDLKNNQSKLSGAVNLIK